jgi:DNA-binding beta-propeller fold protein YncE
LVISRRGFAAAGLGGVLAACSRKLAPRYSGWLFVTSASEKSVVVADLAEFQRIGSVALGTAPGQVLRCGERVFVTCPDARTIVEIDMSRLEAGRKIELPGRIVAAASSEKHLVAATADPPTITIFDPVHNSTKPPGAIRSRLGAAPAAVDFHDDINLVAFAAGNSIFRLSLKDGKIAGETPLASFCTAVQFRNDGQAILAALPDQKQVVSIDTASGVLLARMPLAFAPKRFGAATVDGGQMFVSGESEDTIAIVSPYQSEVAETIVAGRTPRGIAVAGKRNLLLVANPAAGDLTILDIETRKLAASIHVGGTPGEVLVTADEEYALVISQDTGDVSVIRLQTVLDRGVKTKPLFTVFAMGANPQSAAIVPKPA